MKPIQLLSYLLVVSVLFCANGVAVGAVSPAGEQTDGTHGYTLYLPQGYGEESGALPLLVALGNDNTRTGRWADLAPGALVLPLEAAADGIAEAIFHAKAHYPVADHAVYLLAIDSSANSAVAALYSQYPSMFAGVSTPGSAVLETGSEVGQPRLLTDPDNLAARCEALLAKQRSLLYNAAVLKPDISATANSADAQLAADGSLDTAWKPGGPARLTLRLDDDNILHRWVMAFGETAPSRVVLEVSDDGTRWTAVETVRPSGNRLDRYISPTEAKAVRVTVDGGDICELELYSELALSRRFSYQQYRGPGYAMPYRLYLPEGGGDNLPMVVFLHGSGQRGTDNAQHMGVTKSEGAVLWAKDEVQRRNPCIVVVPQIDVDKVWRDRDVITGLHGLIDEVAERCGADRDRVYGTGLSIGAEGWLNYSIRYPDSLAAMLLVAGGPNNPVGNAPPVVDTVVPNAGAYAHIPIWAMQAYDDSVRPIAKTTGMINALRELGVNPRYTVYLPGQMKEVATSTHSSWLYAYEDPRVVPWLFAQTRKAPVVPAAGRYAPLDTDMTAEEILAMAGDGDGYVEFHESAVLQAA